MAKKMPGRLVALSASAVATIYVAGLLSTQPAAQGVAAADSVAATSISATATAVSTSAPAVVVGASTSATATTVPTGTSTAASAANASTYADGTYSATGTSALGNVTVSVTTSGGKIGNLQITKVTTKFPVSRIASLPGEVIQNQTATVNVVTGATYSSQAFKQAVQQALQQALAANSVSAAG